MNQDGIPFMRNNFVAVEVPFHDAMPCPGKWRSFAVMRNPIDRILSSMAFHVQKEQTVLQWITSPHDYKVTPNDKFLSSGYPVVNSMVIRQLLGRERFVNVTPIDEEDFERAKKLVDSFTAFVPLEYLTHEKVLRLLNETIPEYHDELRKDAIVANKNKRNRRFGKAFIQKIAEENHYDSLLYDYVLTKIGIKE
jgi:hypothetical protein